MGARQEFTQELADERNLAIWSALLLRVPIEQVTQLGHEAQGVPAPGSRAALDREADGGIEKAYQAPQIALLWLVAAADQMRGLTSLYEDGHRLHAPRPVVRAIIENTARAVWLLDGPGPEGRAGRIWVNMMRAGAEQVDIFKRTGQLPSAPERFEHVRDGALGLFGAENVKMPSHWNDWSVNGEKSGSLTAVVEGFVDRYFPTEGSGRSYYGILALLQHPTAASAMAYGEKQGDALVFPRWDPKSTFDHVSTSVAAWHVACRRLLEHMGWSCPEFDAWSEAALAALGWPVDYPWPQPPD